MKQTPGVRQDDRRNVSGDGLSPACPWTRCCGRLCRQDLAVPGGRQAAPWLHSAPPPRPPRLSLWPGQGRTGWGPWAVCGGQRGAGGAEQMPAPGLWFFFSLKGRGTDLLVHTPDGLRGRGWARPEPGAPSPAPR